MAHQAHNLPWNTVASNFRFIPLNQRHHSRTSLFPRNKPNQAKDLQYFTVAFARAMADFSTTERSKYQATHYHPPPSPNEPLLSPATRRKIRGLLQKYHLENSNRFANGRECAVAKNHYCQRQVESEVSDEPRHSSRRLEDDNVQVLIDHLACRSSFSASKGHDGVELVKILLLYGEMEPLFRLVAYPHSRVKEAWGPFSNDLPESYGWGEVARTALMAYLCLNLLYLFPETYDPEMRRESAERMAARYRQAAGREVRVAEDEIDYRATAAYQMMLFRCTRSSNVEAHTYPHRDFYGITRDMYSVKYVDSQLGRMPVAAIKGTEYMPSQSDVLQVGNLLASKLPLELVFEILDYAEYRRIGRLDNPRDPLHPANHAELHRYLCYCWDLMVRCDVLVKECNKRINWIGEVTSCIYELWGRDDKMMVKYWGDTHWRGTFRLDWTGDEIERHSYKFV